MNTFSGYPYLVGYLAAYFAGVGGVWLWQWKRQREKPPVAEKLVRGPGESLRRELDRYDRGLVFHLVGCALLPLLILTSGLWLVSGLGSTARLGALIGLAVVLSAALYVSARWLLRLLQRRRELKQRWFNARSVAEAIEPLRLQGLRVFHDVPALEANPPFILDHVIVGPAGVFLLKTKTVNRGKARAGLEEHKIIYDGHELIFPWGDDAKPLAEVRDPAVWLDHWLVQLLGRRVPVHPVLVFPGWWVEDQAAQSNVRVTNPLQVAALAIRRDAALTAEQIELVARHLETRCRDVEA